MLFRLVVRAWFRDCKTEELSVSFERDLNIVFCVLLYPSLMPNFYAANMPWNNVSLYSNPCVCL